MCFTTLASHQDNARIFNLCIGQLLSFIPSENMSAQHLERSIFVPHSGEKMFYLINDIEQYPQFLPWCNRVDILEDSDTKTIATLHIRYMQIQQSFTTENTKIFPRKIQLTLKEGPFHHFNGSWEITSVHHNACQVNFQLTYQFRNKLLEKLALPVFTKISQTFPILFAQRADFIDHHAFV